MAKTTSTSSRSRSTRAKVAPRTYHSPFRRAVPFSAILVVGVLLALFYVNLDTRIERQARAAVQVEEEIRSANHAYNAEKGAWQRTLNPGAIKQSMDQFGLDMSFPSPSRKVVLGSHNHWLRRQVAKAAVAQLPGQQAPLIHVTAEAAATNPELPPPPSWARRFISVSTTSPSSSPSVP